MTCEQLFALFNALQDPCRMLCIDAAAAGCYLVDQGQQEAGLKLLRTALTTAGIDLAWADFILSNRPESLDALAMHAELKRLFA